jgi:hypothetical protein
MRQLIEETRLWEYRFRWLAITRRCRWRAVIDIDPTGVCLCGREAPAKTIELEVGGGLRI